MLLLVTILLVVVGTISLVIGFVQSSLVPIYISIACSVLAAVVLLIFSRMTAKSQQVVTSGDGPAPLGFGGARGAPEPAFAGTGLLEGSSSDDSYQPEDRYGSSSRYVAGEVDLTADEDVADEDDFPIERYDARRVGEILPLLAELDLDELDIVREHEEQGKSRATVLARIDQLIDQLEAEDRQEAASRFDDTEAIPVTSGGGAVDDGYDEPLPAPEAAPPPPLAQSVTVAALPEDDGYFPIEDYDELRASEILPLLPELDDDELEMVQERESNGAARSSILRRIETLLGTGGAGGDGFDDAPAPIPVPAAPEPEPMPALAERDAGGTAPAKRAPAKRAPAKRAAAVVASTPPPTKKAAARKATATRVAKAPAASTSKAGARKAVASTTEAPVKKAGARGGATKATVTKKVTAKKVPAATKAAKSSTAASKAVKASRATKR